jgi:ferredoxin
MQYGIFSCRPIHIGGKGREMRIKVDEGVCVGAGQCEAHLPDVFEVGDDGIVMVNAVAVATHSPAELQWAVGVCPSRALRLE